MVLAFAVRDCDVWRGAELAAAVHRAIARLPERSRVIFALRREQGMSYAEIAGILGISVKTVELVFHLREQHGVGESYHQFDRMQRDYAWISRYTLGVDSTRE